MKSAINYLYTIVFFLVTSSQTFSYGIPWQAGQLVQWDNTVLTGDLSYNWSAEIVILRQTNGLIKAYSASNVRQFGWFDYDLHQQRNFVSLRNAGDAEREQRAFYEVCMDGELTVVRRLKRSRGLFRKAFSHPKHYVDQPKLHQDPSHFDYFVHDGNQFRAFDRFYSDIYQPLMLGQDQALREYIAVHNINKRTILGRLVLVDRYNIMTRYNTKTASARQAATRPD